MEYIEAVTPDLILQVAALWPVVSVAILSISNRIP